MKIVVVHDRTGRIKSLAKVHPDSPFGVGAVPGPGDFAAEIELEPALANAELHEIHANYVVEGIGPGTKLVRKRG